MNAKQEQAELKHRYPEGIQRCEYVYPAHRTKDGKEHPCPFGRNVQGSPFCSEHTYGNELLADAYRRKANVYRSE